jgi:hypothetical protein
MFGTRDLFSKSKQINEAAESFFEKDVNRVANFFAQATSLTSQSSSEEDALIQAREIVEDIRKHSETYYLQRLLQQGKQLSQIIAYIWRWIDVNGNPKQEIAKQLKEYFVRPTIDVSGNGGGNLKNLFAANPKQDKPTTNAVEANLLRQIFPDYDSNNKLIFPIFDDSELGKAGYLIEVTVNGFNGMLEDGDRNNPNTIKFVIPYPPKPQFGEGTITPSELEEWIANKDDKYVADNPYIPTTCS